jgi:protocatechuate 3,4-dioxygenase beta subunit
MTLMTSVTEGPYYLDGALVRKDITEGKAGVPLTLRLTVVDATDGCTPVKGAAVEIWHCDAWGYYSGYTTANPGGSAPAESEEGDSANDLTYLRGYQVANANGVVKFETIFPGWYTPRTCHIHVKVHTGGEKEDGTYEGGKVNYTGQLFFADDIAEEIFTLEPYSKHTGSYTVLAERHGLRRRRRRQRPAHPQGRPQEGPVQGLQGLPDARRRPRRGEHRRGQRRRRHAPERRPDGYAAVRQRLPLGLGLLVRYGPR